VPSQERKGGSWLCAEVSAERNCLKRWCLARKEKGGSQLCTEVSVERDGLKGDTNGILSDFACLIDDEELFSGELTPS